MRSVRTGLLLLVVLVFCVAIAPVFAQGGPPGGPPGGVGPIGPPPNGPQLYSENCSQCHGDAGDSVSNVDLMHGRFRRGTTDAELTGIVLRGSVVTNKRWDNGRPFDADGKGTSDLDVTLVGSKVMDYWDKDAYYIPGLHTKPLCDEDPAIAIGLNKLRKALQRLVGRPVNFQATANLVLYARDVLFNEPYFTVTEAGPGS